MKYYYFLFVISLFGSVKSYSQNLVPNHSFEDYKQCPPSSLFTSSSIKFYIEDWYVPKFHGGSVDYVHSCSGAIINGFNDGHQIPKSGNGYIGLLGGLVPSGEREYLMSNLKANLIKNEKYTLSMWVSLNDARSIAINGLGMALLNEDELDYVTSINNNITGFISGITAQLISQQVVSDKVNWVKIKGEYIAKGDEKYIIIGNFIPNNQLTSIVLANGSGYPYYFIDNITVMKTSEYLATQEIEKKSFSVYPNPATDIINIESEDEIVKDIEINDVNGKLIPLQSINQQTIDISSLASGTYFVKIKADKTEETHKIIKK